MPGIGISIFVGAVGALMRYAVTIHTKGFNVHTGGVILMILGAIGLGLSLLFWSSFAPFGRHETTSRREETINLDGVEQGRVIRETHDHMA